MDQGFIWGVIALLVIGLLGLAVHSGIKEAKRWELFKIEHRCKLVGHTNAIPITGIGISPSGSVVPVFSTVPATNSWLCDDGVAYTR